MGRGFVLEREERRVGGGGGERVGIERTGGIEGQRSGKPRMAFTRMGMHVLNIEIPADCEAESRSHELICSLGVQMQRFE